MILKIYLGKKMERKTLDKIFKFGGMKPTENINRYIAIAASRIEQGRFAQILRNKKWKVKNDF